MNTRVIFLGEVPAGKLRAQHRLVATEICGPKRMSDIGYSFFVIGFLQIFLRKMNRSGAKQGIPNIWVNVLPKKYLGGYTKI